MTGAKAVPIAPAPAPAPIGMQQRIMSTVPAPVPARSPAIPSATASQRVLPRAPPSAPGATVGVGEKRTRSDSGNEEAASAPVPAPPRAEASGSSNGEKSELSPWSIDYEPATLRAPDKPSMKDLSFSYLWGQKVYRPASGPLSVLPSLRWLAKSFSPKILQEGPKCKLVCRLMLRLEQIVASGHATWDNAFEPHRTNYYEILREKFISRPLYVAPTYESLLQGMPEGRERIRHDRDGRRAVQLLELGATSNDENASTSPPATPAPAPPSTPAATPAPILAPAPAPARKPSSVPPPQSVEASPGGKDNTRPDVQLEAAPQRGVKQVASAANDANEQLTVAEFSRLMAVLTLNAQTRAAPRQQSSWDTVIAKLYNDVSFRPKVDVKAAIGVAVDATVAPVRRDGATLRRTYLMVQSLFLQAWYKWTEACEQQSQGRHSVTGPFSRFVNAVTMASNLSLIGRMACIMFELLRCGRDDEISELIGTKLTSGGGVMAVAMAATGDCTQSNVVAPRRKPVKRRKTSKSDLNQGVVDASKLSDAQAQVQAQTQAQAQAQAQAQTPTAASNTAASIPAQPKQPAQPQPPRPPLANTPNAHHMARHAVPRKQTRQPVAVRAKPPAPPPLPVVPRTNHPVAASAPLVSSNGASAARAAGLQAASAVDAAMANANARARVSSTHAHTAHKQAIVQAQAQAQAQVQAQTQARAQVQARRPECCNQAVHECVRGVAESAVSAAVHAALQAQHTNMDVVEEITKLGKLYSIKAQLENDRVAHPILRTYVDNEILAIRTKIEAHQNSRK